MRRLAIVISIIVLMLGIRPIAGEQQKVMNFIAVMDLKCGEGIKSDVCKSLTDVIIDELVKEGTYTVIDRANRDKILGEQGFQQTGCVDESCSVDAGRLLGVGKIVVGSITKIGKTHLVNLQLINVQTGAVETSASERCKCNLDGLIDAVINATVRLMGKAPSTTPPADTRPQPAPAKVGESLEVPAGEFTMGSDSGQPDERPVHRVYLDAFHIDKYETTNEEFQQCVIAGKCTDNQKDEGLTDPKQPVVGVNWNQANAYCSYVGKRLPTEAEWEKAARGTDGRMYPWGNQLASCKYAIMKEGGAGCGKEATWPVGSKPSGASPYGAMDMTGNVWEWTSDWYDKNYYETAPKRNPTGPSSGSLRVLRGGSWVNVPNYLLASFRIGQLPSDRSVLIGFRCAKTP